MGTMGDGFKDVYTNDRGILRIWLASVPQSYGMQITMEDGSVHRFCFSVDENGNMVARDFLVVNGMVVTGDFDQTNT